MTGFQGKDESHFQTHYQKNPSWSFGHNIFFSFQYLLHTPLRTDKKNYCQLRTANTLGGVRVRRGTTPFALLGAKASEKSNMNISQAVGAGVSSVEFGVYTEDEIRRISVKEINNPVLLDNLGHPNPGGLYDLALGPYMGRGSLYVYFTNRPANSMQVRHMQDGRTLLSWAFWTHCPAYSRV